MNPKSVPKSLRLLIIVLFVLGVFFRVTNLDHRFYWGDEVYTSIRISGYRTPELLQQAFDGRVHTIEDLQKYQRINSEKSVFNTINGLALEEPQLSPLYFVMTRFWVQWFGNSVVAIRSLSAVISLLALPSIYWLCQELFESSVVGWLAISMMAISPFHLLYAQEARPYSLWTVTILLSSAALLRAMRHNTKVSWITYSATLVLGLYSFLLSTLVAIAHGIYILAIEGFRFSKKFTAYLLAFLAALFAFAPWLWVVITEIIKKTSAQTASTPQTIFPKIDLLPSIKHLIGIFSRIFFDINLDSESSKGSLFFSIPILVLFALIIYSVYFLCHKTPKQISLFILVLIGFTPALLVLQGLILLQSWSNIPARYLIPSYLATQLAVVYFLTFKSLQHKLWRIFTIILISSGLFSCILISQAEVWWNVQYSSCNPGVARVINQATYPLIITDADGGKYDSAASNVISLSYLLNPKVRFQLLAPLTIPKIPKNFSDIFLFTPSKALRDTLMKEHNYKIEPLYKAHKSYRDSNICLWKVEKVMQS